MKFISKVKFFLFFTYFFWDNFCNSTPSYSYHHRVSAASFAKISPIYFCNRTPSYFYHHRVSAASFAKISPNSFLQSYAQLFLPYHHRVSAASFAKSRTIPFYNRTPSYSYHHIRVSAASFVKSSHYNIHPVILFK